MERVDPLAFDPRPKLKEREFGKLLRYIRLAKACEMETWFWGKPYIRGVNFPASCAFPGIIEFGIFIVIEKIHFKEGKMSDIDIMSTGITVDVSDLEHADRVVFDGWEDKNLPSDGKTSIEHHEESIVKAAELECKEQRDVKPNICREEKDEAALPKEMECRGKDQEDAIPEEELGFTLGPTMPETECRRPSDHAVDPTEDP